MVVAATNFELKKYTKDNKINVITNKQIRQIN